MAYKPQVLPVADGGTGSSTAANARTNIGAAASGANSDITSISGLANTDPTAANQMVRDSFVRAWVTVTGTTGAVLDSHNVSSVSRTAVGTYTVTWAVAFANANYAVFGASEEIDNNWCVTSKTTTNCVVRTRTIAAIPANNDANFSCCAIGPN